LQNCRQHNLSKETRTNKDKMVKVNNRTTNPVETKMVATKTMVTKATTATKAETKEATKEEIKEATKAATKAAVIKAMAAECLTGMTRFPFRSHVGVDSAP